VARKVFGRRQRRLRCASEGRRDRPRRDGRSPGAAAARARHALAVHDSRQAATAPLAALGARVCSSPQEVAEHAGTVLLSLPTPEIVHEVACGPAGLVPWRDHSHVHRPLDHRPAEARVIARELVQAGIELVDAPVSGGVGGAEKRDG